jgi:hypothetical protein
MSFFRPTIEDDRGRPFPLIPREFNLPGRGRAERRGRLVRAQSGPREPRTKREVRRGILWSLLLVPAMVVASVAPVVMSSSLHLPIWADLVTCIPLGLVIPLTVVVVMRGAGGQRLARQYARAGYCGSCGYDVSDADAAEDGCQTCPECGAAWRLREQGGC